MTSMTYFRNFDCVRSLSLLRDEIPLVTSLPWLSWDPKFHIETPMFLVSLSLSPREWLATPSLRHPYHDHSFMVCIICMWILFHSHLSSSSYSVRKVMSSKLILNNACLHSKEEGKMLWKAVVFDAYSGRPRLDAWPVIRYSRKAF